mgnify:CR=1 FL=1
MYQLQYSKQITVTHKSKFLTEEFQLAAVEGLVELERRHSTAPDEMAGGCGASQRMAPLAGGLMGTLQRGSRRHRLRGACTLGTP